MSQDKELIEKVSDVLFEVDMDFRVSIAKEIIKLVRDSESKYQELIYAVATKFPDETRHETALRYIMNAESHCGDQCEESPTNKGGE
jgi:hypothetical protein